jgi:hypothetical protein
VRAVRGGFVWHVACLIRNRPLSDNFMRLMSQQHTIGSDTLGVSNNEAT